MGTHSVTRTRDDTASDPARPLRIGWLVATTNIQSASVRYRCFHMARVLSQSGIESVYFTDADKMANVLATLDAVITIKRMDTGVMRLAALAQQTGTPLFLDFCDDLLSERYAKDPESGLMFAAVAPLAAGITVPSAAMAKRLRETAVKLNTSADLPIHVIPDIAETRTIFHLTEWFLGQDQGPDRAPPSSPAAQERAQVLWFGNFGAGHSNFGILSLQPTLASLSAVNREIPLELVVISNNKDLFSSLVADSDFPARYVPWTAHAVYDALEQADVALLTSGTDDFCAGKSANRPLQALAAGVPVIADPSPALAEFVDVVMIGKYTEHLRRCLGTDPVDRYQTFVAPAAPLLERYSPQSVAGLWRRLLQRSSAVPATSVRPALSNHSAVPDPQRFLIFAEDGTKAPSIEGLLKTAKAAGFDSEVLLTTSALKDQGLRQVLAKAKVIPRVLRREDKVTPRQLAGADLLCLAGQDSPFVDKLKEFASQCRLPIMRAETAPPDWPSLIPPADETAATAAAPVRQPGPNPEAPNSDGTADWIFVVHPKARGWILDGISREIGSRQLTSWTVAYNPPKLPQAKTYFFTHYSLFQGALRKSPEALAKAKTLVWYTHPRNETPESIADLLTALNQAHKVIFACSANRDLWVGRGLDPDRAVVVLGGADPELFTGHTRGGGVIGLSSSFYERKNPDTLRELVELMPGRRFHLIGRDWEQYALLGALLAAPNFRYDTAPYSAYPEIYKTFDVFLSMSKLEGGPIPLLEAMMENAVPVASRTGFAPDLITHGQNGYLFDPDAPASEIVGLIEQAFANTTDIRASVAAYDWDSFARRIVALAA